MTTAVIYDSTFGNTKTIAVAIGSAIPGKNIVLPVQEAHSISLHTVGLLIVGSPTQGGMPTPELQKFLRDIPKDHLKGVKTAAFDTRFLEKDQNIWLRILMKIIGYAAPRIGRSLQQKGGTLITAPEGFIVEEKKGPLRKGEAHRAGDWVKTIASNA